LNAPRTPDVGEKVTGDSLRAQENPIPPPGEATPAKAPLPPKTAGEVVGNTPSPVEMTDYTKINAPEGTRVAGTPEIAAPGASAEVATKPAAPEMRRAPPLFNSPKEEGARETPTPEQLPERAASLDK